MSVSQSAQVSTSVSRRQLLVLLGIAVLVYTVLTGLNGVSDSFRILRRAEPLWVGGALLVTGLSYLLAALVYIFLAKKTLPVWPTVVVQVASTFANRLLPAGIGAIAVNYDYLRRFRHSRLEAGTIVAVNNGLGMIGNGLLLIICLATTNVRPPSRSISPGRIVILGFIIGVTSLLILLSIRQFRYKVRSGLRTVFGALLSYRKHPVYLILALFSSISITVCYTLCLLMCARAVQLDIGLVPLFVCMSVGVVGATIVPTPGGVGGAEIALVAALVVYGAGHPQALAAVVLYRLFIFWLPLLAGGAAFYYARRHNYL